MQINLANQAIAIKVQKLADVLSLHQGLSISFLFGSHARNDCHEDSDWDIAVLFKDNSNGWRNLGELEALRQLIASALQISHNKLDIVDLYRGGLSINATVVDEGIVITGKDNLALAYYYQRVWANLEDFYWNIEHVS